MAFSIVVENDAHNRGELSYLTGDVDAGESVFAVENVTGYAANQHVVIGPEGKEAAELMLIESVDVVNSTITFTTGTQFKHFNDDRVTVFHYDQRKLYGSILEAGPYELIETKDIKVDAASGTEFIYGGSTYKFFKIIYFNSVTAGFTELDDETAISSEKRYYTKVSDIREESGLVDNTSVVDGLINRMRIRAENIADSYIALVYDLPLVTVPPMVKYAVELLAAAMLMHNQMGDHKEAKPESWRSKWKEGMQILKDIRDKKITLVNEVPAVITSGADTGIDGYPDDTTPDSVYDYLDDSND